MGRVHGSKNTVLHRWSTEEKEYLKQITPGNHHKEIQKLINEKFNLNLTLKQIESAIKRNQLNTGFKGHFPKGNIPVNKGKKGICAKGSEKTWFKKGNTPVNHRAIGSERVNVDGYIEIKVAEPNRWRPKHQVLWEEHKGKIPKGHAVIFGDGNSLNLDINNLILVTRQQLLILNTNKLIKNHADLTRTGVIIADIYQKISEKKRLNRGIDKNTSY